MKKIGSHVSFSKTNKYLVGAAKEALSYEATAMMIYLGAPQNTKRAAKEEMFLEQYEKEYMHLMPKENILVHAPYIINPSSIEKHQFAIDFLIKEIEIMNYLGLKQIVLHPGASTKFSREKSIETLVSSLKAILSKTKDVEILLETMSGKGTEIGYKFEELVEIIEKVESKRLRVCIDTCHMWDAGYDVNNVSQLIEQMKKTRLLRYVSAIHINDSKNPMGSRKDRHANLNTGYINTDALKELISLDYFDDMIKVLETPYFEKKPIYKQEIKELREK